MADRKKPSGKQFAAELTESLDSHLAAGEMAQFGALLGKAASLVGISKPASIGWRKLNGDKVERWFGVAAEARETEATTAVIRACVLSDAHLRRLRPTALCSAVEQAVGDSYFPEHLAADLLSVVTARPAFEAIAHHYVHHYASEAGRTNDLARFERLYGIVYPDDSLVEKFGFTLSSGLQRYANENGTAVYTLPTGGPDGILFGVPRLGPPETQNDLLPAPKMVSKLMWLQHEELFSSREGAHCAVASIFETLVRCSKSRDTAIANSARDDFANLSRYWSKNARWYGPVYKPALSRIQAAREAMVVPKVSV